MLKMSKTSSPQKLFDYDCITLYLGKVAPLQSTFSAGISLFYNDPLCSRNIRVADPDNYAPDPDFKIPDHA